MTAAVTVSYHLAASLAFDLNLRAPDRGRWMRLFPLILEKVNCFSTGGGRGWSGAGLDGWPSTYRGMSLRCASRFSRSIAYAC